MNIPTDEEILELLDCLDKEIADNLETHSLDFKPWNGPKNDMRVATELAVCFANADGGVIVFGVADRTLSRAKAIHGAKNYNLDVWRRGLFESIKPNLKLEVEEISIPEGTGKLLLVRVPKGDSPPYGTTQGIYKRRIGKNCMPLDPHSLMRMRISSGAVDWSGELIEGLGVNDLDKLEIERARFILRSKNPESELLKASDNDFLKGLGALRSGKITHTGLLLFGKSHIHSELCPQNQIHYVHQISETNVTRNDIWKTGLLFTLERIEQIFSSPVNPEDELSIGLFKLRIPAYPLESVREAVLNAITHRDYSDPNEILIRHTTQELVITSPGGFIGGITLQNILRHEPVARNRTLANAFVRLRLVEAAGVGRRRIFIPCLSYGKQIPEFATDDQSVTLRLFNRGINRELVKLISQLKQKGYDIGLDHLMVLNHLLEHPFIDSKDAVRIMQVERNEAIDILNHMSLGSSQILERKGHTHSATYHLTKEIMKKLFGKAAYTKSRGLNPTRYAELVREYLKDHKSISNRELRDLLSLGESPSAQVEASRYLAKWAESEGFLKPLGGGSRRRYCMKK